MRNIDPTFHYVAHRALQTLLHQQLHGAASRICSDCSNDTPVSTSVWIEESEIVGERIFCSTCGERWLREYSEHDSDVAHAYGTSAYQYSFQGPSFKFVRCAMLGASLFWVKVGLKRRGKPARFAVVPALVETPGGPSSLVNAVERALPALLDPDRDPPKKIMLEIATLRLSESRPTVDDPRWKALRRDENRVLTMLATQPIEG